MLGLARSSSLTSHLRCFKPVQLVSRTPTISCSRLLVPRFLKARSLSTAYESKAFSVAASSRNYSNHVSTEKIKFDVAAGVYESTLNNMVEQVYNALHSSLLKGSIEINKAGFSSVDFDFQEAPTVGLVPSPDANAHIASALESYYAEQKVHEAFSADEKSAILAMSTSATFALSLSKLALTLNYSNGSEPTTLPANSLAAHATICVDDSKLKPELTVKVLDGTVTVPNDPDLSKILNNAILPSLLELLNNKILKPIKIPPIKYQSIEISAPLPVVQSSYLTAYSALGSTPPDIPAALPWPKDGVYIAADIATLEKAARLKFPLGPHEEFNWKIFSGKVGATLEPPKISSIADDGSITASIKANALAQLTMQIPFIHYSIGPTATAGVDWIVRPVVKDGELIIFSKDINISTFEFDFADVDLPSWAKKILYPFKRGLGLALNALLSPLIRKILDRPWPILPLPNIHFDFGKDSKIDIAIDNVTPSGLQKSLLVLDAQTTIKKS